jgi:hypothetical protein
MTPAARQFGAYVTAACAVREQELTMLGVVRGLGDPRRGTLPE